MYPSAQEQAVLAAAEALMQDTMAAYDPSHDAHHVHRVRNTALALAAAHPAAPDRLTVELAALLHDTADKKYAPAAAADPYAFLLPLFTRLAPTLDLVADGRARAVARIVANVSWSTEQALRAQGALSEWHATCAELHCVQDADRLDAMGAFGIMRCAAYSAASNRPLYIPGPPQDTAIQHFHDKLLKLKDRLKTEAGRRWGEQRHQVMLDFLKAVEQEAVVPAAYSRAASLGRP